MNKAFLWVGGIGLLLAVTLFFIGLKKQPVDLVQAEPEPVAADLALSDVTFIETYQGIKQWEIVAREARLFEYDQTALFKKLFVKKSQNGFSLTVSGEVGKIDTEGKTVSVYREGGGSPVLIWMSNGYLLRTNSLKWSSQEALIQTDDPVELVGSRISIRGEGLRVFTDRAELMILKNGQADVY
jgi:LPS export ABC transporter protein LptC